MSRTHFFSAIKSFTSCILALVVASVAPCVFAANQPSLGEIIAVLEKQREQVKSLYIETESYATTSVKPEVLHSWPMYRHYDFTYLDKYHFAFKGGKRYLRSMQTIEGDKESGAQRVSKPISEQAQDGKIHWERRIHLESGPARLFTRPYDPMLQWIPNPGYCMNIGWDCKTELNTHDESALSYYRSNDLLYLLKDGAFTIEEGAAELDGVNCIVIRRNFEIRIRTTASSSEPSVFQATQKIWLDLEHGFAVRQIERDIKTYAFGRTVNTNFVEILPGIWFPKKSEVRSLAPPDAPKEYQGREVLSWHVDLTHWTVNDVPDERFHIVSKPSDILMNSGTKGEWVIESPDGLVDLETMDGARDSSVSAGLLSTSTSSPAIKSDEQIALVKSLTKAVAANSSDASQLRVVIATGEGCGPIERDIEPLQKQLQCNFETVKLADIRTGVLKKFDVVLFPGGQAIKQGAALGEEGRRAIRQFVEAGGGYIGICAGGKLATTGFDWSLGLINVKTLSGTKESPGPDGVMLVDMTIRGSGIAKMKMTDSGHAVLGGQTDLVDTRFAVSPIFLPAGKADLPEYVCLASYHTEFWLHKVQRGTMVGSPNILAAKFGKGHVIIFSSHPEANQETQKMLAQAILAVASVPSE